MLGIAVGLVPGYGGPWIRLFVFVVVGAAFALATRPALAAVGITTLLALGSGLAAGVEPSTVTQIAGLCAALGLGMVGTARLVAVNRQLHAARRELARLAVTDERLRIARDLHDLLGHSLTLIAIKSQLARRLTTAAPKRAQVENEQIEAVARAALDEVRQVVSGYRQPT